MEYIISHFFLKKQYFVKKKIKIHKNFYFGKNKINIAREIIMAVFGSEKRFCARVAVGSRDAIIGKIRFFDGSYREGSILCLFADESPDREQILLRPPLAVVIICRGGSESVCAFCSLGVPCVVVDYNDIFSRLINERVALIDTERGFLMLDPSIETLNFYSASFSCERGSHKLGCEVGSIIEPPRLDALSLSRKREGSERFLVSSEYPLCRGEAFFDDALSLWEALSPELIVIELRVPHGEAEERLFSESVEQLFRASVYGNFLISLCGFDCESELSLALCSLHKAFCLLCAEGREFNGYIPRGITLDAPLWLMRDSPVTNPDFIIFDFDKLFPAIFGLSCEEILKKEKALKKEFFSVLERYFSYFAPRCDVFFKSRELTGSLILREAVGLVGVKTVFS